MRTIALAFSLLSVAGCTMTHQVYDKQYQAPASDYRLVVMQPDVQVSLLTTGGIYEQREDWTNQARVHVLKALHGQQRLRGGEVVVASTREEAGGDLQAVMDLTRLHAAVGQAIRVHKYAGLVLPTKKTSFDWTLGELAVSYGRDTSFDYALFLRAEDSFASGGRKALTILSFMSCITGFCVIPPGATQSAFASLVDLKTGRVVWFNVLSSSVGDIRTEDGAQDLVDELLTTMQPGSR